MTDKTPAGHKVAACQFEPVVGDEDANLASIRRLATDADATFAVFPELAVTGYSVPTALDAATSVPGPVTDRLRDIAASTETTIVVGLPEREADNVYNDLVAVTGDGVVAVYRKQYLWGDESDAFATGHGPVTVETDVGTVGFLLCYDLNFPEAALAYAEDGVDVLAVSAAWRESYRADWRLLLRTRGLDGPCYTVGANHAGDQQGRLHRGGSLISAPTGEVLDDCSDGPAAVTVPVESQDLIGARKRNPVRDTRHKR